MTVLLAAAEAKDPWVWGVAAVTALSLLVLNVLLLVAVHARRIRQAVRTRREKRFRARVDEVLDELDPRTSRREPGCLRAQLASVDELERPLAAVALIERMRPATREERELTLETLREAGAVDVVTRRVQ